MASSNHRPPALLQARQKITEMHEHLRAESSISLRPRGLKSRSFCGRQRVVGTHNFIVAYQSAHKGGQILLQGYGFKATVTDVLTSRIDVAAGLGSRMIEGNKTPIGDNVYHWVSFLW